MPFFEQAASPEVREDSTQGAKLTPYGGWPERLSLQLPGWPMPFVQRRMMLVLPESPAQ